MSVRQLSRPLGYLIKMAHMVDVENFLDYLVHYILARPNAYNVDCYKYFQSYAGLI